MRREVGRLKREMNAVSAQDEFSKWAKIRREHDKMLAEHDKKGMLYGLGWLKGCWDYGEVCEE